MTLQLPPLSEDKRYTSQKVSEDTLALHGHEYMRLRSLLHCHLMSTHCRDRCLALKIIAYSRVSDTPSQHNLPFSTLHCSVVPCE